MTVEQALQLLVNTLAQVKLTLPEHDLWKKAVEIIRLELEKKEAADASIK